MNAEVEPGLFGPRLVVHGSWRRDPGLKEFMVREGIKELMLNYARGWNSVEGVGFLKALGFLEGIQIVEYNLPDVSEVNTLSNLRYLLVDTHCKTELDFGNFPRLQICYLEWRPKAKSLFDCSHLLNLGIGHFKGKECEDFRKLINLRVFTIGSSPLVTLAGLEGIEQLRRVGLFALQKLTDIEPILKLPRLERLELVGCRYVESIENLRHCSNLRVLDLRDNGEIDSIAFLEGLQNLEEVYLFGTTRIRDGDLTPLLRLPKLKYIRLARCRYYSHTEEEICTLTGAESRLPSTPPLLYD